MTDIAELVRALLNGCMHGGARECPRCSAARALESQAAELATLRAQLAAVTACRGCGVPDCHCLSK
jgi:hypothetical protein